ncbi:MAG: hypothetical protein AAF264_04025 [Pseudomonadota bacterium]
MILPGPTIRLVAICLAIIAVAALIWVVLDGQRDVGRAQERAQQQEIDDDAIRRGREGRDAALREFDDHELHDEFGDE